MCGRGREQRRTAAFCSSFSRFFSAWAAASLHSAQVRFRSQRREVRMPQNEWRCIAPLIPLLRGEATIIPLLRVGPRLLQILRLALLTRQAARHPASPANPAAARQEHGGSRTTVRRRRFNARQALTSMNVESNEAAGSRRRPATIDRSIILYRHSAHRRHARYARDGSDGGNSLRITDQCSL